MSIFPRKWERRELWDYLNLLKELKLGKDISSRIKPEDRKKKKD